MTFRSGIGYLLCRIERKLVLFFDHGGKGKRVHEQSVGSSAPSRNYETIKIVSTQKGASIRIGSTKSTHHRARVGHADSTGIVISQADKVFTRGDCRVIHMKQGFPHLGTAGSTSHHDCVLSLPADWPGRAPGVITLVWEGDTPSASIGDSGRAPEPEFPFPRGAGSIVRRSVRHLSTCPCQGLSFSYWCHQELRIIEKHSDSWRR